MRTCNGCGADMSNEPDEFRFCPYCGDELEDRNGPHEEEQ